MSKTDWALKKRCQRLFPLVGKKCNRCSRRLFLQRHHRDRDRSNNSSENVEILCRWCHQDEHISAGDWAKMKGKLEYG